MKLLCKICAHYSLLPKSLQIELCYHPAGVTHCRGGFADVWKGNHHGLEVYAVWNVTKLTIVKMAHFVPICANFPQVPRWLSPPLTVVQTFVERCPESPTFVSDIRLSSKFINNCRLLWETFNICLQTFDSRLQTLDGCLRMFDGCSQTLNSHSRSFDGRLWMFNSRLWVMFCWAAKIMGHTGSKFDCWNLGIHN